MTKLEREIIRETNVKLDDRNLIIHLTPDNQIGFRAKGLSKSPFFITIKKVYELALLDTEDEVPEAPEVSGLSMKQIFADLEEETSMPWPYKAALRKFLRRNYSK